MSSADLCACTSLRWRIVRRRGVRMCGMGVGRMAAQLLWTWRGRVLLARAWSGTRDSIVGRPSLLCVLIEPVSNTANHFHVRYTRTSNGRRSGGELGPQPDMARTTARQGHRPLPDKQTAECREGSHPRSGSDSAVAFTVRRVIHACLSDTFGNKGVDLRMIEYSQTCRAPFKESEIFRAADIRTLQCNECVS
jgi:hypothetical protein